MNERILARLGFYFKNHSKILSYKVHCHYLWSRSFIFLWISLFWNYNDHKMGLFEKWSILGPKKFDAIPFQKLLFLISFYPEFSDGKKKRLIFLFVTLLILLVNMSISLFRWTVKLIKTQKFFAAKTTKLCSIILVSKIIEFYRYTKNEKWNT